MSLWCLSSCLVGTLTPPPPLSPHLTLKLNRIIRWSATQWWQAFLLFDAIFHSTWQNSCRYFFGKNKFSLNMQRRKLIWRYNTKFYRLNIVCNRFVWRYEQWNDINNKSGVFVPLVFSNLTKTFWVFFFLISIFPTKTVSGKFWQIVVCMKLLQTLLQWMQ